MDNSQQIQKLIDDKAFYYISPHGELHISESGQVLFPGVFGGWMAKAFWIKDSPSPVWLFEDIYATKEKFTSMLVSAFKRGASKQSVLAVAKQGGGQEFCYEIMDLITTIK